MRMTETTRRAENPRAEPEALSALASPAWLRSCRRPVILPEAKLCANRVDLAAVLKGHLAGEWEDDPAYWEKNLEALRSGGLIATRRRCLVKPDLYALTQFVPGVIPMTPQTLVGTEDDFRHLLKLNEVIELGGRSDPKEAR